MKVTLATSSASKDLAAYMNVDPVLRHAVDQIRRIGIFDGY